jgi:hypothetical protein
MGWRQVWMDVFWFATRRGFRVKRNNNSPRKFATTMAPRENPTKDEICSKYQGNVKLYTHNLGAGFISTVTPVCTSVGSLVVDYSEYTIVLAVVATNISLAVTFS